MGRKLCFTVLIIMVLIAPISSILPLIKLSQASSIVEDDVRNFLPSLNYSWSLLKGDEGCTGFSPSPIPCKPQIAYECEIPTAQMVLVENGIIFSFDPNGRSGDAYALNETTGKILWRTDVYFSLYRFITRNALGKYYYVGTTGNEQAPSLLIALDKRAGEIVWTVEVDIDDIWALIVYDGRIYLGTRTGLVSCLDENGHVLWRKTLESKAVTDLAYGDGRLYVNLEWSKNLYALDAENGKIIWIFNGDDYLSEVVFRNGLVLVQEYNRRLIGLSSNGKVLWNIEISVQAFSVGEDKIYVFDYRKLYVLNFEGKKIGEFNIPEDERFFREYSGWDIKYPIAVATKDIVPLPVVGKGYGRLYLLWRGITTIFNLTYYGEGVTPPITSIAYGRIYVVFCAGNKILLYKLHDVEKPIFASVEAASEVYEGEELVVRATVYDNRSGIYRTLLAYSIDGGEWNYIDMRLERRYLVEPVCGYGFSKEPYIGKILAQRAGSKINWRVIAIDNVGNYVISQEGVCQVIEKRDSNPPVTEVIYEDIWHNEDFIIILRATDDLSGVAETYYRVNNDVIKRVSADGYPLITVESANNTLEYWSVDKAGNEEAHKIITGIKLDKSIPIANAGEDRIAYVGDTVIFDAASSRDNIGIASYEWDFGDGERGTGVRVTHVYKKVGSYTVTLIVKDYAGNIGTHSVTVNIVETFPTLQAVVAIILAVIMITAIILVSSRRVKEDDLRHAKTS